jgi:hypothetical protein
LSWYALLQYLARVQPIGDLPLAGVLTSAPLQAFVVAVLPCPDPIITAALHRLHLQSVRVLAVVLDPATFPDAPNVGARGGAPSPLDAPALAADLNAAGLSTCLIRFGDDWAAQLQQAYHSAPLSVEAAL